VLIAVLKLIEQAHACQPHFVTVTDSMSRAKSGRDTAAAPHYCSNEAGVRQMVSDPKQTSSLRPLSVRLAAMEPGRP
jgi:hypothetical protein